MSQPPQKNAGWLCQWCRVMNGKHAMHCHRCGGRWDTVGEDQQTSYENWDGWEASHYHQDQRSTQWPKSPRRKGKGKNHGKGKSPRRTKKDNKQGTPRAQGQDQEAPQRTPAAPPPPGTSWMQAAQQLVPPTVPATTTAAPSTSSTVVPPEYKGLIETLKRHSSNGTLPEEIQQELKTMKVKEEREQTKELFQAVKSLSRARKELREAHDARSNLHSQWRTFLALSISQWQEFTEQFQSQEAAALRHIAEAKAALEESRTQFEGSKVHATGTGTGENNANQEMDLVSDDEAVKAESSAAKLQAGLQNLTQSLQTLSTEAETIHAAEQASKKARLEEPGTVVAPTMPSLQPFPPPGTKRPAGVGA